MTFDIVKSFLIDHFQNREIDFPSIINRLKSQREQIIRLKFRPDLDNLEKLDVYRMVILNGVFDETGTKAEIEIASILRVYTTGKQVISRTNNNQRYACLSC